MIIIDAVAFLSKEKVGGKESEKTEYRIQETEHRRPYH